MALNPELIPATQAQQPILANLFELYAYDFAAFHDVELGEDGRFGFPDLPLYWSEPNRHPFLVRIDGKLAGFAFVKRGSRRSSDPAIWDMAQFFILRPYRRRGCGTAIAHQIWEKFSGRWEVRVMESNHSAHDFWQRAISLFVRRHVTSARHLLAANYWRVFSFESAGSAGTLRTSKPLS